MAHAQDMRIDPAQESLTVSRLIPAMSAILDRLRVHRDAVDRIYEAQRQAHPNAVTPDTNALPLSQYPVGFCRHIRDDVWHRALADPDFRRLLTPGLVLRKVFILLKGQYFQNAMQVGNLYVDVANDTVWVHKPKLEWMHIAEVDYRNVESWDYFAEIAESYLEIKLFPNFFFPFAFPVSPFLAIRPEGRLTLLFAQDALFLKDLAEGMPRIRALLANETWMNRRLPPAYAELLERTFTPAPPKGFPLPFEPTDARSIERGIVAEFDALRQKPPAEAVVSVDRYMHLVAKASQALSHLNLVPAVFKS